jgi:FkbM family methyltransferase
MRNFLLSSYRGIVKVARKTPLSRIRSARACANFVMRFLKQPSAVVDGHKMVLDRRDALNLSVWGIFEPCESEYIKRTVKEGWSVLDIGANIGYYTLMFAKLVRDKGTVYAFEPDPETFRLLERNVRANCYGNVRLFQKALSNLNENTRLFRDRKMPTQNSLSNVAATTEHVNVHAVRLDDVDELKDVHISFIKMDIEGSELKALQGMQNLIRRHKSLRLMIEFFPLALNASGTAPEELLKYLRDLEFDISLIDSTRNTITRVSDKELLQAFPLDGRIRLSDLLCSKGY